MTEHTYTIEVELASVYARLIGDLGGRWHELANASLVTTRDAYVAAMRHGITEDGELEFFLEGDLATWVEDGRAPFDMKTLLSRDSKINKEGKRYKTFRFSRGPEGRIPFGLAEGRAHGEAAGARTAAIVGGVASMLQLGTKLNRSGLRFGDAIPKVKEAHTVNLYEGLRRAQSGFENFRTMTENSAGWLHPGFQPKHLLMQVAPDPEAVVRGVLRSELEV